MYENHSKTNWTILNKNVQNFYRFSSQNVRSGSELAKKFRIRPDLDPDPQNYKLRDRRSHSHLEDKDQISDEFLLWCLGRGGPDTRDRLGATSDRRLLFGGRVTAGRATASVHIRLLKDGRVGTRPGIIKLLVICRTLGPVSCNQCCGSGFGIRDE